MFDFLTHRCLWCVFKVGGIFMSRSNYDIRVKSIIKHIIKNENGALLCGCDIGFSCHIIPPLVQDKAFKQCRSEVF